MLFSLISCTSKGLCSGVPITLRRPPIQIGFKATIYCQLYIYCSFFPHIFLLNVYVLSTVFLKICQDSWYIYIFRVTYVKLSTFSKKQTIFCVYFVSTLHLFFSVFWWRNWGLSWLCLFSFIMKLGCQCKLGLVYGGYR